MQDFRDHWLADTQFVVIDFEAVTPRQSLPFPIELAAVAVTGIRTDEPRVLVDELIRLDDPSLLTEADTRQTGITPFMLSGARSASAVFCDFAECLPVDAFLVAHNASFERSVLQAVPDEGGLLDRAAREQHVDDLLCDGAVGTAQTVDHVERLLAVQCAELLEQQFDRVPRINRVPRVN